MAFRVEITRKPNTTPTQFWSGCYRKQAGEAGWQWFLRLQEANASVRIFLALPACSGRCFRPL
jgi:hypothetical protein